MTTQRTSPNSNAHTHSNTHPYQRLRSGDVFASKVMCGASAPPPLPPLRHQSPILGSASGGAKPRDGDDALGVSAAAPDPIRPVARKAGSTGPGASPTVATPAAVAAAAATGAAAAAVVVPPVSLVAVRPAGGGVSATPVGEAGLAAGSVAKGGRAPTHPGAATATATAAAAGPVAKAGGPRGHSVRALSDTPALPGHTLGGGRDAMSAASLEVVTAFNQPGAPSPLDTYYEQGSGIGDSVVPASSATPPATGAGAGTGTGAAGATTQVPAPIASPAPMAVPGSGGDADSEPDGAGAAAKDRGAAPVPAAGSAPLSADAPAAGGKATPSDGRKAAVPAAAAPGTGTATSTGASVPPAAPPKTVLPPPPPRVPSAARGATVLAAGAAAPPPKAGDGGSGAPTGATASTRPSGAVPVVSAGSLLNRELQRVSARQTTSVSLPPAPGPATTASPAPAPAVAAAPAAAAAAGTAAVKAAGGKGAAAAAEDKKPATGAKAASTAAATSAGTNVASSATATGSTAATTSTTASAAAGTAAAATSGSGSSAPAAPSGQPTTGGGRKNSVRCPACARALGSPVAHLVPLVVCAGRFCLCPLLLTPRPLSGAQLHLRVCACLIVGACVAWTGRHSIPSARVQAWHQYCQRHPSAQGCSHDGGVTAAHPAAGGPADRRPRCVCASPHRPNRPARHPVGAPLACAPACGPPIRAAASGAPMLQLGVYCPVLPCTGVRTRSV